ncbi:hypothetical protein G6Z92_18615 [Vibrio aestuarianus subsp. cardii]|uniref:DUF3150 domain-containing protein n=1 Tax=Vibrio aestuarianus TaxID=28171 RepID=UPI0015C52618|nr:DUF3150 domain-containing protein [Vibrio aestuarianus]NGZ68930.1 hypothetical protein [Vibrio aestuarianus subsp. cardii]
MKTSNTQILQDVIAVHLRFSTWTGRKKLAENDLSLRGEAPPKELIALGSKYTTDASYLKVFNTLKRRAERLCLSIGIPFMGGYAVPSSKADTLAIGLNKIVQDYEKEANAYCAKHDSIQDEWVSKFPEYELKLRAALTPAQEVKSKISAAFSMFKVQSAQSAVQSVDVSMKQEVEGLSLSLDDDIMRGASKLLTSLTDAISPNRTNVNGLVNLREKVEGLAFLNGRFNRLVHEIKKVEGKMPITGKLSTDETNILSGLLFRMADKDKLKLLMQSLDDAEPNMTATIPSVQSEPQLSGDFEPMVESQSDVTFSDDDFSFDIGDDPTLDDPTIKEPVTIDMEHQTVPLKTEATQDDVLLEGDVFSFDFGEQEQDMPFDAVDSDTDNEEMPLHQVTNDQQASNTEWFF